MSVESCGTNYSRRLPSARDGTFLPVGYSLFFNLLQISVKKLILRISASEPLCSLRHKVTSLSRSDLFWIGTVLLIAGWVFLQSYEKWLNPIIDTGRDLQIPGELLKGKKLYRDILYFYPPLTPYLLSLIQRFLGNSLQIYTVIGVTVSAVIVTAIYIAIRLLVHSTAAGLASLLFVTLNFTGDSEYNFIFT